MGPAIDRFPGSSTSLVRSDGGAASIQGRGNPSQRYYGQERVASEQCRGAAKRASPSYYHRTYWPPGDAFPLTCSFLVTLALGMSRGHPCLPPSSVGIPMPSHDGQLSEPSHFHSDSSLTSARPALPASFDIHLPPAHPPRHLHFLSLSNGHRSCTLSFAYSDALHFIIDSLVMTDRPSYTCFLTMSFPGRADPVSISVLPWRGNDCCYDILLPQRAGVAHSSRVRLVRARRT